MVLLIKSYQFCYYFIREMYIDFCCLVIWYVMGNMVFGNLWRVEILYNSFEYEQIILVEGLFEILNNVR